MRRFITVLILVPLAIIVLAFAVANRQPVTFTLDPLGILGSELSLSAPLFVLAFVLVMAGVILGGVAAWVGQGRWRRAARRAEDRARYLAAENEGLRRRVAAAEVAPAPAITARLPARRSA